MKKILLCLFFLFLYTTPVRAEDFKIAAYEVLIYIQPDSIANVVETIHVEFTKPLHGIYRKIPYRYPSNGFFNQILITDIQVPGEMFQTYQKGDYQYIKIGYPQGMVSGNKTYKIMYQVYGFREIFKSKPGFYWNIIGRDWDLPIENVSFKVILPMGLISHVKSASAFHQSEVKGYLPVKLTNESNSIQGNVDFLYPHETLTIKIPWSKEALSPGPFPIRFRLWWANFFLFFIPFSILCAVLLIKKLKLPKIRTQNSPPQIPDMLTPAEVGVIIDDKLDNRDLISFIFLWAIQGIVIITERPIDSKKIDFVISRIKELPDDRQSFEKSFFKGIFPNRKVKKVILSSLINIKMNEGIKRAKNELEKHMINKGIHKRNRFSVELSFKFLGITLLALGTLLGSFYQRPDIFISLLISGGILLCFGSHAPKTQKTAKGWELYEEIQAFKCYLANIDKNTLQNLIKSDPTFLDKVLPYTIAMGISSKWINKTSSFLNQLPVWYNVTSGNFSKEEEISSEFAETIIFCMNCFNCIINNASLPPEYQMPNNKNHIRYYRGSRGGSGGCSGSGFSGGGAIGGGGGGGW